MSSLRTNQTKVVKQKMVRLVKIPTFEDMCGILINRGGHGNHFKGIHSTQSSKHKFDFPCKSETSML